MEIYIDKAFLDKFYAKYDAENDTHKNLRKFISKANMGKVFLDFDYSTREEYDKATTENPFLDELIDVKSYTITSTFKEDCRNVNFYETGSASKYFFVEGINNQEIEDNYGCVAISSNELEKVDFLLNWLILPISKKKNFPNNWDFLDRFKHPCNAMVLTDNYLFDYNAQEMKENLIPFLKKLLPKTLEIEFQLTIIGKDTKKTIDFKQKKVEIEKALEAFNYPINLTIIPEAVHDRNIFTNYYWINSGVGFSIFKVEGGRLKLKNDSMFTFYPISYINTDFKAYFSESTKVVADSVLSCRNEILDNCKKMNQKDFLELAGNKRNRLLT